MYFIVLLCEYSRTHLFIVLQQGKGANGIKSPKSKTAKTPVAPHKGLRQLSESEDDGDYATLRELPGMTMSQPPPPIPTNESAEDSVSEDNKVSYKT